MFFFYEIEMFEVTDEPPDVSMAQGKENVPCIFLLSASKDLPLWMTETIQPTEEEPTDMYVPTDLPFFDWNFD